MEVILLERIKSLGQMGDRVHVKAGYARNFLLPFKKALRANKDNLEKFEKEKVNLEAKNLETKTEAEKIAKELKSKKIVLIRSAAESGALYGSVTARDIELAVSESGLIINRRQATQLYQAHRQGKHDGSSQFLRPGLRQKTLQLKKNDACFEGLWQKPVV